MPCRSEWPSDYEMEKRRELDLVTRVACELGKLVPKHQMSKETLAWVEKHEAIDQRRKRAKEERKRKERLKRVALSKLTAEEQKALGVK